MTTPETSDTLAVGEKLFEWLNSTFFEDVEQFKEFATQLEKGKSVNDVKDGKNKGILHFAAEEGNFEMCKYLIEELYVDVNARDKDGETPLIHAAREGHSAIAIYLVEHGGDPSISSHVGATALHHAAGLGDIELLRLLLSKGVDVDLQSDISSPLIWSVNNCQLDAVKILLDHNANPNTISNDNYTPLYLAVSNDSLRCVELLIEAGGNVNVCINNATPLLNIAADMGSLKIIKYLLKAGAEPNARDEDGLKAIHAAAKRGNREAVEILVPVTWPDHNVKFYKWTANGILGQSQPNNPDHIVSLPEEKRPYVHDYYREGFELKKIKDYYREGFQLQKIKKYKEAANAYYKGLRLSVTHDHDIVSHFRKVVQLAEDSMANLKVTTLAENSMANLKV